MEKKKTKKKWREIRSAVTMMCVMAAMLSTATFAWFTLSSSPVVNGLQMTAASSEGLKISKNQTTWHNAIDMGEASDGAAAIASKTLYPATLVSTELNSGVPAFLKPVYEGFAVTGTEAVGAQEIDTYVASCTYFLKNESTEEANVGIMTVDPDTITADNIGVTTDNNPKAEGSFVKLITDGDAEGITDNSAVEAVRVALVVDGSILVVYEPNSGSTTLTNSTSATNKLVTTPVAANVVSSYDTGEITSSNPTSSSTSQSLFTIAAGGVAEVKMYVWFEGQDAQCVDQIMKDQVEVQIQFTTVTGN